jgi:hypothetical protein
MANVEENGNGEQGDFPEIIRTGNSKNRHDQFRAGAGLPADA